MKELIPSKWNGHTPLLSYSAGNNLAVAPMALSGLKQNLRSYSSGKGRSDQQARTSALCEALERYSGKYRGEEITLRGSLRQFGDAGIHPNKLMLYSEKQYRERDTWNARGSQFQVVPYWLEETEITDWTPVWSHSEKRIKYLPASLLFYSYPAQGPRFTSWADSNGSAAGASYEDAVLQGLFELVERDSVAIWWYNRVQRPRVDLTALDDPFISNMQAWFAQMGREFWDPILCVPKPSHLWADRGYRDGFWGPSGRTHWHLAGHHRNEPVYASGFGCGQRWRDALRL